MKRILLICPSNAIEVFSSSKIRVAIPLIPYISLASLAGALIKAGHEVRILDLSVSRAPEADLVAGIQSFKPDYAGLTFTSALSNEARDLAGRIKRISPGTLVIGGGVHATTLPEETLADPAFDIIVIGEGEETIVEIAGGRELKSISGIAYKEAGAIRRNPGRPLLADLDDLPMPAWHLYKLSRYHTPRINARKSRVGAMETSRGCPFGCCFCNKTVFKNVFRAKSPERVVFEMEHMLKSGFQEIHIWEDGFSTDLDRAKQICRLIIKKKLRLSWNIYNGIRIDRLDEELLRLLKEAGCYRISVGIESGNEDVLRSLGKNITPDQVRAAVRSTQKAGIECLGFFLVGLPQDTERSMQDTIAFAKELNLDLAKVGIFMPLPGTPIHAEWTEKGLIVSKDMSNYTFHAETSQVYRHPNLSYDTIRAYYDRFYRELYLSPRFILKRLWRGIKTGDIFWDIYYFAKTLPYGWYSARKQG